MKIKAGDLVTYRHRGEKYLREAVVVKVYPNDHDYLEVRYGVDGKKSVIRYSAIESSVPLRKWATTGRVVTVNRCLFECLVESVKVTEGVPMICTYPDGEPSQAKWQNADRVFPMDL